MTDLFSLDFNRYLYFLLVFFRVSAILFTVPVLGSGTIPGSVKIGLSLIFSLIIFNLLPASALSAYSPDSYGIILLAVKEILFGIFLGLIPHILFAAVELAGNIIAFMMGLSIANVFDPSTNSQTQVISGFKNALMIMLFLALNAHHVIFEAILASFRAVPVTTLTIPDTLYENTVRYFADIFFIALRLSYPIIAVTMLTNFVFGMLGKSIPQMNVFVVGAPLGILIGLLYLALGMPVTVNTMQTLLFENLSFWVELIRGWK